jgi:hypothetical protein
LQDSRYDPIPEFELLLSRFTEKPIAEEILLQMGSYYLFIKDDLTTAYRQYWSKVISENPDSGKLKVCNISVIVGSYICMCVYIYIYIYIYVCVCVCACVRACMRSEYIFWILTKGIALSLVLVCHSYNRLQDGTLYDKIYEVLYASVYMLLESENISQGSKLVYFSLRIQVWGHLFSTCSGLCCDVEFIHRVDRSFTEISFD